MMEKNTNPAGSVIARLEARVAELESELFAWRDKYMFQAGQFDSLKEVATKLAAERAEREEQEPVAYMRKWKFDGEEPKKERNESGKMAWPFKFKLHPVTVNRCLNDDIRLYAAPPVTEHGHVTVTTDESGRAVAVTRQDDEHRILSVIWEAPVTLVGREPVFQCKNCRGIYAEKLTQCDCMPEKQEWLEGVMSFEEQPVTAPVRLTNQDFDRMYNEAGFEPNEMREAAEHMFDAIQSAVLRANGFKIDHSKQALELVGLRGCNSLHGGVRKPDPCIYRMRTTDPGCAGCAERDEDQPTEAA